MDKKTIILVVLLGLLVIFWIPIMTKLGLMKPVPQRPRTAPADTTQTTVTPAPSAVDTIKAMTIDSTAPASMRQTEENIPEDTIVVETSVWIVTLTNHGGGPISFKLKKYSYINDGMIEMLPDCHKATPDFSFNGGTFEAGKVVYEASLPKGTYQVSQKPLEISYTFKKDSLSTLTKRYHFYPDRYDYDLVIDIADRPAFGFEREYSLDWDNHLAPTELDLVSEHNAMWAMAYQGNTRVKFDKYNNHRFNRTETGNTSWIANRSKYFTTILIPRSQEGSAAKAAGVDTSIITDQGSTILMRQVTIGLAMAMPNRPALTDSFSVFVGPIDYDLLQNFNNNVVDIIDIGTTPVVGWIIKIFAIPIMWLMPRMYTIIPNYGFVIIIFSLIVKVLTWPLSRKTVQSMMAMKEIQPKMEELKKKHKNNPQELNRQMMKLYKDHGINPFSGCLPYLPQLPLFIALYSVFSATILLRQAPFILWWNDLSRGALSFTDPYIILVVLMMGLMFLQQKMTMTDPKNKMLIYLMPLMMGFFFYRASAGLVLYWTCFSLFSFIEQLVFKPNRPSVTVVQE